MLAQKKSICLGKPETLADNIILHDNRKKLVLIAFVQLDFRVLRLPT